MLICLYQPCFRRSFLRLFILSLSLLPDVLCPRVQRSLHLYIFHLSPPLFVSQSVGSMCVCLCASGFFMHLTSAIRAIRLLHYFASFSLSFPLLPLPSLTPSSSSPLLSLIYYRFLLPFLSIFIRIILLSLIISINIHTHFAPFLITVSTNDAFS